MIPKRPMSWFLTETGKRTVFGLATATGIGLSLVQFTSHTMFLYKYKEIVHYYNRGKIVELSPELETRCKQCLDLLKISDIHKKLIQPFSVYGFDLFHAGSTTSKYGAAIGIPVNFTYKSQEDMEKDKIQVNQNLVDFTTELGQKLKNALILPEKVQQFAICREILTAHSSKVYFDSVYPFVSIFLAYNISQGINTKLNLYAAPIALRGILYIMTGLFSTGVYFLMKDYTEVWYETEVDKELCNLGKDFIESGIIFYDKILQRNQALRELMGSEGAKKYSKTGNENFFIRQPRMAIVHRKKYFEQRLQELTKDSEEIKL